MMLLVSHRLLEHFGANWKPPGRHHPRKRMIEYPPPVGIGGVGSTICLTGYWVPAFVGMTALE
jgi:hypothetical protein